MTIAGSVSIPFHRAAAATVAQTTQKAIELFLKNSFDGVANVRPQPLLNRVEAIFEGQ